MHLSKLDTRAPKDVDKETTHAQTQALLERMREQQQALYAQKKYSLLVVLQGLDASGKDGVINHVFSNLNLLGCTVKAFKAPSEEEQAHDFLWRVHPHAPAKGMISLFNRSHYEDVLVPRVEKWIDKQTLKQRFDHINHFERLLESNGTRVLKFYLHISKEKQLERLNERLENPEKYWKHDDKDFTVREKWDAYAEAYEDVFEHCGPHNPWHLIPADQKWYKEHLIAKTVTHELGKLDLEYPHPPKNIE